MTDLTEEELVSYAKARAKYEESLTWAHYIGRMSPERLEQQRAYDRERGRKYYQENKESRGQYSKEWHQQNKQRLREKHVCDLCGGRYTNCKKSQHCKTQKHQRATQQR
jgi:hypothetical protein